MAQPSLLLEPVTAEFQRAAALGHGPYQLISRRPFGNASPCNWGAFADDWDAGRASLSEHGDRRVVVRCHDEARCGIRGDTTAPLYQQLTLGIRLAGIGLTVSTPSPAKR